MPPNQVFAAVGACIYCGSTESPLTDEHIIPFGLNGNLILPKASCKTCATITGEIERFCLRPMLGDFRSTTGLRTRRKKTRPKTITVRHRDVRRGVEISEDIRTDNYPRIALGYCFPPPGILYNGHPNAPIEGELMSGVLLSELDRIRKPGTELILKLGTFNALTFMRMLAKIGHAWAIATLGRDAFTPLLPDLILGKNNTARWLVGADPKAKNLPPNPAAAHDFGLEFMRVPGGTYLLAGIRLFAPVPMPKYHVVVAKCNLKLKARLFYQAARHAIAAQKSAPEKFP